MGNFTVDPAKVRDSATRLSDQVAPGYAASASTLSSTGRIDGPGLGIAMSWLEALYESRLDFLAVDVRGAHDVVADVASRLQATAAQYEHAEDLNVSGFDGRGDTGQGFGGAFGAALGDSVVAGGIAGGIELGVVLACAGTLATCAGLCPAFVPAAVMIPLFIANIPSIFSAGAALVGEAAHLKDVLNAAFEQVCDGAKDGWEGEGATDFGLMVTKIKAHLDQLADYISALGTAVEALGGIFVALWAYLIAVAAPFLAWLIAMRLAEAAPPWLQDAVLEPIIEGAGAVLGSGILTTLAGVATAGGAVAALLTGVGGQLLAALNLPDAGRAGVPDMQEFHVDQNYRTPL